MGRTVQYKELIIWAFWANVWKLVPIITSCVTLSKLFNFSMPQFPHLLLLFFSSVAKSCPTLLWPHELTVVHQALLSMGFSGQEYWVGGHFLLQGIFQPRDGTCISCIAGGFFTAEPPGKQTKYICIKFHTHRKLINVSITLLDQVQSWLIS